MRALTASCLCGLLVAIAKWRLCVRRIVESFRSDGSIELIEIDDDDVRSEGLLLKPVQRRRSKAAVGVCHPPRHATECGRR